MSKRFDTRLRRLRHLYHRLSAPRRRQVLKAAVALRDGSRPPRVWVFLDGSTY